MSEFKIKNIIPTASEARGLCSSNGVYFPSNTNLFKMDKNEFSLVSSCDGLIKHFSVNRDFSFLCTKDRIYFNHFQHFVGSLRRSTSAIDSCDTFFAIGNNNILEVWLIPQEYKFCLFSLQSRHVGHHRPISHIKIISDSLIATASEDCSVRLFDIKKKTSKVVATLNDIPVGLHHNDNELSITSRNGSIVYVNLDTLEYKNLKYDGEIKSSSSYNDMVALAVSNMVIEQKVEEVELLPSKDKSIKKKEISKKSCLIILKNSEEIFRCEVDPLINEISLENSTIFVRSPDFISSFDIQTETFTHTLSLPTITSISVFKNILAASCKDKSVCIYRDNVCVSNLKDPKSRGDIIFSHVSSNICTVVYTSGYVSCFNINDSQCFRSFCVSDEPFSPMSSSCVSEDGCFLFVSDNASVKVIDLIKGKLLDTITVKSPILKMVFYRDFLYTLELEKVLTKHSVFSGISDNVFLEDLPTNLSIRNTNIVVSTIKGVLIYDLNLNHVDLFSVQLEARNRSEMYIKNKPVEHVDFNSSYIFCGGQSNSLKIFENSAFSSKKKVLMKTPLVQIITISRNKDLENAKAKIYREKDTPFDKNNIAEVRNLLVCNDKMYLHTREDVCIYEKVETSFTPIEFDILPTEEFVKSNLDNSLKSLIAAIKLNNAVLIKLVVDHCLDIDFTVKYLPPRYAKVFLEFIFEMLKQDFTDFKLLEILNKLIFYHKVTLPGMLETLSAGLKPLYSDVKKNKFLLDAIVKK